MFKLVVFIPQENLEDVKESMFAAGAGQIGDYDQCCWQVRGEGQFRPLPGSNPHLGETGALETVDEFRVELVCSDDRITQVLAAMKNAHPYETPAYDVIHLVDL